MNILSWQIWVDGMSYRAGARVRAELRVFGAVGVGVLGVGVLRAGPLGVEPREA